MLADSHGDEVQAQRTLAGAIARHAGAPLADRAAAWAYLAELRIRLDDVGGAQRAADEIARLADATDLSPGDQEAVGRALREVAELPIALRGSADQ